MGQTQSLTGYSNKITQVVNNMYGAESEHYDSQSINKEDGVVLWLDKELEPDDEMLRSVKLADYFVNFDVIDDSSHDDMVARECNHGLIGTAVTACNRHLGLGITPDILWSSIMLSFSSYMNNPAIVQTFGPKIVNEDNHENGLSIAGDKDTEMRELLRRYIKVISRKTQDKINQWIEPNFSTTTNSDVITCKMTMIGYPQEINTNFCNTNNGIPYIILYGHVKDWVLLRKKIDGLITFNDEILTNWHTLLVPIVDNIIKTYLKISLIKSSKLKVDINYNLWKNMIVCVDGSYEKQSYVSGWLLAFAPFSINGAWILDKELNYYSNISTGVLNESCLCSTMFMMSVENGALRYNVYSGSIYPRYFRDKKLLLPVNSWIVAIPKDNPIKYKLSKEVPDFVEC